MWGRGHHAVVLALTALGCASCTSDLGDPLGGQDAAPRQFDGGAPDGNAPPTPDASPDAAPPCVEGDLQGVDPASGHCYVVFLTDFQAWPFAELECQDIGARLATITSDQETVFVASLFNGVAFDPANRQTTDFWIGLNDRDVEMTFEWQSGEPFVYDNWRANEPNNNEPNDPLGEDCTAFEADLGGLWDDRSCTFVPFGYICER